MSLLPLIFKDMERSLRMMEHQMHRPDDHFPGVVYPFALNSGFKCDGKESVVQDKDKYQVKLDVKNFAPEEITIKTKDDNTIVVEAKHEKNDDNGHHVFRHVLRKFTIPEGHDMKGVESNLSSTGMLTITAPNKVKETQGRSIPITHIESKSIKN